MTKCWKRPVDYRRRGRETLMENHEVAHSNEHPGKQAYTIIQNIYDTFKRTIRVISRENTACFYFSFHEKRFRRN